MICAEGNFPIPSETIRAEPQTEMEEFAYRVADDLHRTLGFDRGRLSLLTAHQGESMFTNLEDRSQESSMLIGTNFGYVVTEAIRNNRVDDLINVVSETGFRNGMVSNQYDNNVPIRLVDFERMFKYNRHSLSGLPGLYDEESLRNAEVPFLMGVMKDFTHQDIMVQVAYQAEALQQAYQAIRGGQ